MAKRAAHRFVFRHRQTFLVVGAATDMRGYLTRTLLCFAFLFFFPFFKKTPLFSFLFPPQPGGDLLKLRRSPADQAEYVQFIARKREEYVSLSDYVVHKVLGYALHTDPELKKQVRICMFRLSTTRNPACSLICTSFRKQSKLSGPRPRATVF